jgi:NADPH:quinone reductase-like Zn-dependent oxidoreductase
MKAVVAREYGGPDALAVEEIPLPRPGSGQIQVRIRATALNPADLRTLSGVLRGLTPLEFPYVLGSDFAGTVTEVGPDVTRFAVDDEVFGVGLPRATGKMATMLSTPPSLTTGTMAQYAVFEADTPAIARRPDNLDAERAATLPIAGLTALSLLRAGRFEGSGKEPSASGQAVVLVAGAAGGVGSAVVPLLAAAGVHVIATAIPDDDQYARDLGAAEVIDYHSVDIVAETMRRHPEGVDALINLAMSGPALVETSRVVRSGGQLLNAAFPSPDPSAFDGAGLVVQTVYSTAGPGDLDRLAEHALDNTLPSTISRRYTLEQAPQAYADLVNTHVRGKLLVTVAPETSVATAVPISNAAGRTGVPVE